MENKNNLKFIDAKLGSLDLDAFVLNPELDKDHFKMAFVSGGQGGGKIASEFCRLNFPLVSYNTSKEDLKDLEKTISGIDAASRGEFKAIHLEGEGGASKDIDMGYQAVVDNIGLIEDKLVGEQAIKDADFVWIVVSAGGGTGAGSLSLVARIVAMMRAHKTIVRGGVEKQTFGLIVAIPDERTCKLKIAVNVAKVIAEIEELHSQMQLGAVLLIDNGKIVDDFNKTYEDTVTSKTWAIDGNTKVARMITELSLLTGLSGSEVFDKSELLDIWSTPGYLNLAKKELGEGWVKEYVENKDGDLNINVEELASKDYSIDALTNKEKQVILSSLVKDAFEDNVFVSGIEFDSVIHGGMVVMTDGKVLNTRDAKTLQDAMEIDVLNGDAIEAPHFGFIKNQLYKGTLQHKKEPKDQDGRIYAQCVSYTPPKYIMDWLEGAEAKQRNSEKKLEELNKRRSSISSMVGRLNTNSQIKKGEETDAKSSLASLLGSDRGVKPKAQATAEKISLSDLIKNTGKGASAPSKPSAKDELANMLKRNMNN